MGELDIIFHKILIIFCKCQNIRTNIFTILFLYVRVTSYHFVDIAWLYMLFTVIFVVINSGVPLLKIRVGSNIMPWFFIDFYLFINFPYSEQGDMIALMGWMFYFSRTKVSQSDNLSKIVECVHQRYTYTLLLL